MINVSKHIIQKSANKFYKESKDIILHFYFNKATYSFYYIHLVKFTDAFMIPEERRQITRRELYDNV